MALKDVLLYFMTLADASIIMGYLYIAGFVAPKLLVRLKRTIYGGIAFFLLCAMTHGHEVVDALVYGPSRSLTHVAFMFVLCVAQAVAVWTFISGLNAEFIVTKKLPQHKH